MKCVPYVVCAARLDICPMHTFFQYSILEKCVHGALHNICVHLDFTIECLTSRPHPHVTIDADPNSF